MQDAECRMQNEKSGFFIPHSALLKDCLDAGERMGYVRKS